MRFLHTVFWFCSYKSFEINTVRRYEGFHLERRRSTFWYPIFEDRQLETLIFSSRNSAFRQTGVEVKPELVDNFWNTWSELHKIRNLTFTTLFWYMHVSCPHRTCSYMVASSTFFHVYLKNGSRNFHWSTTLTLEMSVIFVGKIISERLWTTGHISR